MTAGLLAGKTAVVTGANQGIGKVTAKALAGMGARVVLVCRSAPKGEAAAREITQAGGEAELVLADLSSQAQVRRAAAEIRGRHPSLDVLVNNAGVIVPDRRSTVDGVEETLAINHLAYFLLTLELLEPLTRAPSARVVNVASRAHFRGRLDLDDLQSSRGYRATRVYQTSKLMNVLFTYELARRLAGTRVTANCLHPGVIASGFAQTYGGLLSFAWKVASPLLMSPEDGARTSIYLASSPEVEGVTGAYFDACKPARSSSASYDVEAQRGLWARSLTLVGVEDASLWAGLARSSPPA